MLTPTATIHRDDAHNHLHGLGYDAARDQLYLATHYGLFLLDEATGNASALYQVGAIRHDLMGFHVHPHDDGVVFASGHPATGGNLGLLRSDDGGQSWDLISTGANTETVDFHAMSLSAADGDLIAGWFAGRLYVSEDGGRTWRTESGLLGGPCWGATCMALDSQERDVLWRADGDGVQVSHDLGRAWNPYAAGVHAGIYAHPADGALWVWSLEEGALRFATPHDNATGAESRGTGFTPRDNGFVFQWSGSPQDARILFAASASAQSSQVFRTLDGGENWTVIFEA